MRIDVTPQLCLIGKRQNCLLCPVAIAIQQQARITVIVHQDHIILPGGERWEMPDWMALRVMSYDRGFAMTPFFFDLPLPEPSVAVAV